MANFATLADLLSACVNRVKADACSSLFEAATPPGWGAPTNTLNAAEDIALFPWHQPDKLFALLRQFYSVSPSNHMLEVPYMPYLNWAPSAWVLPLKFTGGGYVAGGKCMFDSEGNLWVGDNFTVGWQGQDSLWQGHATKFAPNGKTALADHYGFYRRRNGRRHLRRCGRFPRQRLAHHVWQQDHFRIRQEREASDAA